MTRAERHEQVTALKRSGMTFKEIAAHLGVSFSTVTSAYYDPEGVKDRERKQRRSRPCVDCGKTVTNSGSEPPERCIACRKRFEREQRHWTRERLIAAVREFADRHGRAPKSTDWPAGPRPAVAQREFGSWNAMIEAAGFEPIPVGWKVPPSVHAARVAEAARLYAEGLSSIAIAGRMGCSPSAVNRWLAEAGVQMRKPWEWRARRFAWSCDFPACRECGGTDSPHGARGLCLRCYQRLRYQARRAVAA